MAEAGKTVCIIPPRGRAFSDEHERSTRRVLAARIAELLEGRFGGELDAGAEPPAEPYFLPAETLLVDEAAAFGIAGESDLFGGVVPHTFVATKAVTHGLVAPNAKAPPGWRPLERRSDSVLRGFTAFDRPDARRAGDRLLEHGDVRLKRGSGVGGSGQDVVSSARELAEALEAMDWDEVGSLGLALEQDLKRATTHSVGRVRVGGITACYHGLQKETLNRQGRRTYGGSALLVVRGDFPDLLRLDLPEPVRQAIRQAQDFDRAVSRAYPAFFASRRNYDVIQGFDREGQARSGVLEQSWRIGGASGAEIAALLSFRQHPSREVVKARTVEQYSTATEVPSQALLLFRGTDPRVGPMTKYAVTELP